MDQAYFFANGRWLFFTYSHTSAITFPLVSYKHGAKLIIVALANILAIILWRKLTLSPWAIPLGDGETIEAQMEEELDIRTREEQSGAN